LERCGPDTLFNEIEAIRYLTQLPEAQKARVRIVFARDLLATSLMDW
jgi:hypothetical protein